VLFGIFELVLFRVRRSPTTLRHLRFSAAGHASLAPGQHNLQIQQETSRESMARKAKRGAFINGCWILFPCCTFPMCLKCSREGCKDSGVQKGTGKNLESDEDGELTVALCDQSKHYTIPCSFRIGWSDRILMFFLMSPLGMAPMIRTRSLSTKSGLPSKRRKSGLCMALGSNARCAASAKGQGNMQGNGVNSGQSRRLCYF
jgi:hypothetical protein